MKSHFVLVCFYLIFVYCGINVVESKSLDPLVAIPTLGLVRGSRMSSFNGREFLAFRGIPYAEPPVGELRFKEPVAVGPWTGKVLDASLEGPTCIHYDDLLQKVIGVEECLRLNIYAHETEKNGELKPVMVWIHGGGFISGSGNGESNLYGPNYILDRDIVLVTLNYRLGALGFFTTDDAEAPGNYGLFDQTLALKWVKNHIQNFGGDPNSVTIFGESSGGASVEFHILSPHSKGLFHRAISQSGSTMSPWALQTDNKGYSQILVQDMKCQSSSSKEILACLKNVKPEDIFGFSRKIRERDPSTTATFSPRIDAERESPFLPAHPKELIKQKRFNPVPYISGLNENEGMLVVAYLLAKEGELMNIYKKNPIKYMGNLLGIQLRPDRFNIAKRVDDQYFDHKKSYEEQLDEIEKVFSDGLFFKPIQDSVTLMSSFSDQPVYYYNFMHRSQLVNLAKLIAPTAGVNQLQGVGHADELGMIFNSKFLPPLSALEDIKVSNMLLDLWTSFAKNGVPKSSLLPDDWLPYKEETPRYLIINATDAGMMNQSMPFLNRLSFWEGLIE